MKKLAILAISCLFFSVTAYAAIDVHTFDSAEQEEQFKSLSNTLRCPKCQNNTIADSNAGLAQDLRQKVYEMTKEGKSEQQIIDYMVARYGNFVTYDPPMTLATSILWLGPFSVLALGAGFIVIRSRNNSKKRKNPASDEWDKDQEERLNSLLSDSDESATSQQDLDTKQVKK
ncbi:cytochrome c-type biogenesis protein [Aliivibrio kagoshimensis]|uniref:cytochrome c-type biogenesis protein n=1 Tax=Aliivibrio kagoshimensis TaxID=2910230 RepID=UPI003D11672F